MIASNPSMEKNRVLKMVNEEKLDGVMNDGLSKSNG
jgi:hypothetical protein